MIPVSREEAHRRREDSMILVKAKIGSVEAVTPGENLPAKPAAKIDLKSGEDGSVVETLNGTLDQFPYKTKWIARKKGVEWGKPEVLISAEAAGAKASGENKFKLKRLPDYAKETALGPSQDPATPCQRPAPRSPMRIRRKSRRTSSPS